MHKLSNVFVLEITRVRTLAFEADSTGQALEFALSPWFLEAVSDFLEKAASCPVSFDTQRVRAATAPEAAIYCKLREELDGFTRPFLVADLSGFVERHAAGSVEALV